MTTNLTTCMTEALTEGPTVPRDAVRCLPWAADEYIVVNGFKLVYTRTRREGLLVRMPGRTTATVDELRAHGMTVVMPSSRRHEAPVKHGQDDAQPTAVAA